MKWLGAAFLAAGTAASLAAQSGMGPGAGKDLRSVPILKVEPHTDARAAGEAALRLVCTLTPGWHVNSHKPSEDYLIATEVKPDPAKGVRFEEARYPDGVLKKFAFSETPLSVYEGVFTIEVPFRFDGAVPALSGRIEYQACNDKSCLAPTSVSFEVAAPGGDGGRAAAAAAVPLSAAPKGGASATGSSKDFGDMLERNGLFLVLLTVFAGGLALNLTPCVYPVIPLTVGYFGNQSSGSRGRLFGLAGLYVLGMATMYSILGVAAALSGRLFGSMLQNPWVLAAIAAALVAMALSMFGFWEMRMPTKLMNRAGARAGAAGAFGMGLFVGVVAAPCVGGFIVGLLAFVAARQDPLLGLLFFFTLSLGLGLPYLFLAAYSGRLSRLPRAGEWMEGVKKIFGWVLLAMAAYFLRSIVPPPMGKWLLPAVLAIGAVAILVTRLGLRWPIRAGAAAILVGIAIFFVPRELKGWQPYAPQAIGAGTPAIVDFSAEWCLPCLELERKTFADPRVAEALSRRALLKADMTKIGSPESMALAEKFGILGVPTVIFLDADGKERRELRLVGFENADRFLERLAKAP
ncbi:MAG TPA: cytochrome c biogenesis protein CcdA [Thermoanaerobaculia bacterium]|nr:cytochrome c biogenesis protein CcdA [Thermoanaerobaculia bacterium]